ncbi:hypothetical protein HMPREF9554_00030 [Treponema phagedenis F0421]|nr:hypothetical protein HMPREF9554_00030 [Treponema phagedenis F0421]
MQNCKTKAFKLAGLVLPMVSLPTLALCRTLSIIIKILKLARLIFMIFLRFV